MPEAADLERLLLHWIMAYAGLSAAWFLADGGEDAARTELVVAELAVREPARTHSKS